MVFCCEGGVVSTVLIVTFDGAPLTFGLIVGFIELVLVVVVVVLSSEFVKLLIGVTSVVNEVLSKYFLK